MDDGRGFEEDRVEPDQEPATGEPRIEIGSDERRMHVRAYNHWVSLLRSRAYPSIEDLDPAGIADFGPHSVLLDFSRGIDDPAVAFLGRALRTECALDASVRLISQVPSRSLLSRLTDHYLQIIANRAPIGFEAEFVSSRGYNTMYRGILMPFSSDVDTIDFIYGVINWKELVDAETQAALDAEVAAAIRAAPRALVPAPVWADGPNADRHDADVATIAPVGNLAEQLMMAQETAAAVRAADTRGRAALHRALGRAHDFAVAADRDPERYEALLDQAGIMLQLHAPMMPIVNLIFGIDYDVTRLTEYSAVLSHARRLGIAAGGLGGLLDRHEDGIKGVVDAEGALRQLATKPAIDYRAVLAGKPTLATVTLRTGVKAGEYVVLLGRADSEDGVRIVAAIDDVALIDNAIHASAR